MGWLVAVSTEPCLQLVSVKCRCKCRSPALIPSQPLSRLIENRNRPSAATSALQFLMFTAVALSVGCATASTPSRTLWDFASFSYNTTRPAAFVLENHQHKPSFSYGAYSGTFHYLGSSSAFVHLVLTLFRSYLPLSTSQV